MRKGRQGSFRVERGGGRDERIGIRPTVLMLENNVLTIMFSFS